MRIYLLHIHKDRTEGEWDVFDEYLHFGDFDSLCAEFQNQLSFYKKLGLKLIGIEEPTLDEGDNKVSGYFKFVDSSGYSFMARVADIDIGD